MKNYFSVHMKHHVKFKLDKFKCAVSRVDYRTPPVAISMFPLQQKKLHARLGSWRVEGRHQKRHSKLIYTNGAET
jgi:hypothetical protein